MSKISLQLKADHPVMTQGRKRDPFTGVVTFAPPSTGDILHTVALAYGLDERRIQEMHSRGEIQFDKQADKSLLITGSLLENVQPSAE